MKTKKISFEIIAQTIVTQTFEIPSNYPTKKASIEDLYSDIESKFEADVQENVLEGEFDSDVFDIDSLNYNGFLGFTVEKEGKLTSVIQCGKKQIRKTFDY